MPDMLIRQVPDGLHRTLKRLAAANRRSLSREVLVILERALDERAGPPTLEEIDGLRVRGTRPLDQELLDRARALGRP